MRVLVHLGVVMERGGLGEEVKPTTRDWICTAIPLYNCLEMKHCQVLGIPQYIKCAWKWGYTQRQHHFH